MSELTLNVLQNQSMLSMYGLPDPATNTPPRSNTPDYNGNGVDLCGADGSKSSSSNNSPSPRPSNAITTIGGLVEGISSVFKQAAVAKETGDGDMLWVEKKAKFIELMNRVDLETTEVSKYTFFDSIIPYTRNLIATDNNNYTLLMLCWAAGKESRIHDHPGQGCFVRTLSGCVKETRYTVNHSTGDILFERENLFNEGAVSYMSNDLGLHKIGNPNPDVGAISLHLYVPPFQTCRVWAEADDPRQRQDAAPGKLANALTGRITHFSEYGVRSSALYRSKEDLMYYI